ncbi:hypothetical protein [Nocardia shimofusensis]|uniref:hypothetical protein n=1 Tax=Nocardia shimofusensis TaxID=228596 RepID=UPI000A6F8CAB|nr:hypothetical protein [Nocardia shimofusensis]
MPKSSSARRRRRTRRIAEEAGLSFAAAQRRGDELAEHARLKAWLRPHKIEIDGVLRYVRRRDAAHLDPAGLHDPTEADVVAAAEVLSPRVRRLSSARLRPVTVPGPDGQPHRLVQCEDPGRFHTSVRQVIEHLTHVREDAEIAYIEWHTVARAFYEITVPLRGLLRITDGPLRDQLGLAVKAAEVLSTSAEAVHSRGCLLGAGENRSRRGEGYSPCGGGPVRVRVRIHDDETIVTDPGCPRHAAEEIAYHDYDVEEGYSDVEILGGTDADLDTIYDLAAAVRRERQQRQRERNLSPGVFVLVSPPWMQRRTPGDHR